MTWILYVLFMGDKRDAVHHREKIFLDRTRSV